MKGIFSGGGTIGSVSPLLAMAEAVRQQQPKAEFLWLATKNGPEKCSGLDIKQYNEKSLTAELENGFKKIRCIIEDHKTPFDTIQSFLFCSFKRQLN